MLRIKPLMKNTFLILLLSLMIINISAQENKFPEPQIEYNPQSYICYRTWDRFSIDGDLEEYGWLVADWSDNFVDIEGNLKPLPYKNTRMKMLWDDSYLYIAAELEEDHIWGKIKTHDEVIYLDNDFEVFIDPDCDNHNYFELEVNALETVWDLLIRKPYRDESNVSLNAYEMMGLKVGVKHFGTINNPSDKDQKWTVEIAIPWKSIKEFNSANCPPKEGDQWKINFSRVTWETDIVDGKYIKRKDPETNKVLPEHNWVWSPQGLIAMHYPERWGTVEFSYKVIDSGLPSKTKINPDDEARNALMKIYYAQKNFFNVNHHYCEDISKLNIAELNLEKYNWNPEIETTSSLFEASITSKDGNEKLTVYQDGLIKKYYLKK